MHSNHILQGDEQDTANAESRKYETKKIIQSEQLRKKFKVQRSKNLRWMANMKENDGKKP